jgi:hypothetical protein
MGRRGTQNCAWNPTAYGAPFGSRSRDVWRLNDFVRKRLFQRTAVIRTIDSYKQLDVKRREMTRDFFKKTEHSARASALHGVLTAVRDQVGDPFLNNRAVWVARTLTAWSHLDRAGHPVGYDWDQTATSVAGLPCGFIDRLSRSRGPLQATRSHMVSLPFRLFGVHELFGHDALLVVEQTAQQPAHAGAALKQE